MEWIEERKADQPPPYSVEFDFGHGELTLCEDCIEECVTILVAAKQWIVDRKKEFWC